MPEFVAWQLNQLPAQCYFDREAEGSAAKSIKRPALERVSLSLPAIKEQGTILNLHKNLYEQKLIYRELIKNADKTMKNIALNLVQRPAYIDGLSCSVSVQDKAQLAVNGP